MWLGSKTIILKDKFSIFSDIKQANRDRIDVCYHNQFKSVAEQ